MAVINKKKPTAAAEETTKKVVKKAVTKKVTPAKATEKKVVKKASPAKAEKKVEKKAATTPAGRKSISKKPATEKKVSTEIKIGGQATQDQFIEIFAKKLNETSFEVNKKEVHQIMKYYSETLKEVTNKASFYDTTSGIFYARRSIATRITNPPKAEGGLQTLMLEHPEIKVRKIVNIGDEVIKYFGTYNEEDNTFTANVYDEDGNATGKTIVIDIEKEEEKLSKIFNGTVASKKKSVKEEVEEDTEEVDDEEVTDEEEVDEDVEELEEELEEEDEDDEIFDDEDEE